MKRFNCQVCEQTIYFENTQCLSSKSALGYVPEKKTLMAFHQGENDLTSLSDQKKFRRCRNGITYSACNWMVESDSKHDYCFACRFNRTIPNLSVSKNIEHWKILESSKRRLIYSLLEFGLPLSNKHEDPEGGLEFEFLKDTHERIMANEPVMTGHLDGTITLNIAEADDAERERRRLKLKEDFRTVLGHFRHEIGHYYWLLLIQNTGRFDSFRKMFGDENLNYQNAMNRYYQHGANDSWRQSFISGYASSHPWEDFAESWGHYFTIIDTLETSIQFGVKFSDNDEHLDPYHCSSFQKMLDQWLPLTNSINNINRSVGRPDLYPFILTPRVVEKLIFIHDLVQEHRS